MPKDEDNSYSPYDKLNIIQTTLLSLTDGETDPELAQYYETQLNYLDECKEYITTLQKKLRTQHNPEDNPQQYHINVDPHTIELLDVIKKYNEDASYNKVILFLILQYGERLQEHHPEALEIINEKTPVEDEETIE